MPKSKKSVPKFKNDTRIEFLEIGSDDDHVHFLVQSVPMYSPKQLVQTIKSITGA
jgi:REP element-mobilizing transposase RayT